VGGLLEYTTGKHCVMCGLGSTAYEVTIVPQFTGESASVAASPASLASLPSLPEPPVPPLDPLLVSVATEPPVEPVVLAPPRPPVPVDAALALPLDVPVVSAPPTPVDPDARLVVAPLATPPGGDSLHATATKGDANARAAVRPMGSVR